MAASPLTLLENIDFDLEHHDSMQDVNSALSACNKVINTMQQLPRPMTVYDSAIVYDSDNQRNQQWSLYLQRNPELAAQYSEEDWDEEKKAFALIPNAVHMANQRNSMFYICSMQNPVFSHSWNIRHWGGQDTPELRAKFYRRDNEWHEFVIIISNQNAYIYDPSYTFEAPSPNRKRKLKELPFVGTKSFKFLSAVKTRLAIKKVWIGGGGNEEGHCRKMSLAFVRRVVEELAQGGGNIDIAKLGGIKWEEVNNS
jgi:hypothetical protein